MHIYTRISYFFFWETYFVGTISTQKTWGVLTDLRNMQLPKATKSWAKFVETRNIEKQLPGMVVVGWK